MLLKASGGSRERQQPRAKASMETQLQTTTDNIPTKARGFDLSLAIEYRYKNHLTLQEIGDKLGVTKQCVEQRLAKVIKLIGDPSQHNCSTNRLRRKYRKD